MSPQEKTGKSPAIPRRRPLLNARSQMLTDRFLFTLQDGFVLTTAIISAVLLTIGIRVVKRHDEENQN